MPVASRFTASPQASRLLAIAATAVIALSGCVTKPVEAPPPAPVVDNGPQPAHPLTENSPAFYTMPNIAADHVPVRVGVILPFSSGTPAVKALASSMLKAAQLAVYE